MNQTQGEPILTPENPFFHRGPIQDSRYFFGRVAETRETLEMLRKGQCVSIVGPRRIGKTSFLLYLCDPEAQRRHSLGKTCLFVYVDCQGMRDLDRPGFYQWLWQETRKALAERGEGDGRPTSISDFGEFREALMTLRRPQRECKPIFLLDEFETIGRNPHLEDLFSNLRSLVPAVVYATASQDSLFDLARVDGSMLSSPFFNVFTEIPLGFLKPEEAEEMVSRLLGIANQERLFTGEDLRFVFDLGGYHPFFLQLACYSLFDQKMGTRESAAVDFESVRQRYIGDTKGHFQYIWDHLDTNERKTLQLVSKGRIKRLDDEQRRGLERKCILRKNTFFSSVFAEFVGRQVTKTKQTIGARIKETFKAKGGQVLNCFKKTLVALVAALFVFSAVLMGPDLPDLVLSVLGIENVTSVSVPSDGSEVLVKIYSPRLLLVGRVARVRAQTYGPGEPEFEMTAADPRSDVIITQGENGFEIECKRTKLTPFFRPAPITLRVTATMARTATADITVKTSHFISLLASVVVLCTSGGFSVKEFLKLLLIAKKQTGNAQP